MSALTKFSETRSCGAAVLDLAAVFVFDRVAAGAPDRDGETERRAGDQQRWRRSTTRRGARRAAGRLLRSVGCFCMIPLCPSMPRRNRRHPTATIAAFTARRAAPPPRSRPRRPIMSSSGRSCATAAGDASGAGRTTTCTCDRAPASTPLPSRRERTVLGRELPGQRPRVDGPVDEIVAERTDRTHREREPADPHRSLADHGALRVEAQAVPAQFASPVGHQRVQRRAGQTQDRRGQHRGAGVHGPTVIDALDHDRLRQHPIVRQMEGRRQRPAPFHAPR